ncbi:PREDICTED: Fc receptor-like protein 2, partial [Galeopterus variegatus]|uniref:Fc receptor-like protein 2 n=1 Tax=Galeopterus variegatus TaxID=482537 RepID=A0ABM0SAN7_GALVR
MLLWPLLLVLAPVGVQSDWLSIDMPHHAYEGDEVVVRCSEKNNNDIRRLMYYKDGSQISIYQSASSYTISNAEISDGGSYYCMAHIRHAIFASVTEKSSSIQLTVQELFPAPELRVRPSEPTEGTPVNLSCDTQLPLDRSGTELHYSFFRNGHILMGWKSSKFWISEIWKEDLGYYRCEAMTASPSVLRQSQQSYIHVQRIPVSQVSMDTQPPGGQAFDGEMLVLVCSVTEGTGDTTFSWHREDTKESLGMKTQHSQAAELEIPVIRENNTGGYYCTADNSYGPVQSEVVSITMRIPVSQPLLPFSAPGALAFIGDVVELHCEDRRAPPPILYWFYLENIILGNTSVPFGEGASLNLSLTAEHSGNYFCEADNGHGAQCSEVVALDVAARTYPPSKIRLRNCPHRCEGRVEMEKEGRWGTMCDDGWDMKDVAVLCWELGCGAAKHTPAGMLYAPVAEEAQPVFIQVVLCYGTEEAMGECGQVETFDCEPDEDAGAVCE